MDGCDYVLHTASPFLTTNSQHQIETAVDGTLNVLRWCAKTPSVKKVVLTSSCVSVNEGHDEEREFTEVILRNTAYLFKQKF